MPTKTCISETVRTVLDTTPGWIRVLLYVLILPALVMWVYGFLLQIDIATALSRGMEIYYEQQDKNTDRIIEAMNSRLDAVDLRMRDIQADMASATGVLGERVTSIEYWVCAHIQLQPFEQPTPVFCSVQSQ